MYRRKFKFGEEKIHFKFILAPFSGQDVERRGLGWGTKRTRRTSTLSVIFYLFKEIWKNIHNFPFSVLDICILCRVFVVVGK